MRVRFLSKGSPEQISGGYLYNKYVLQHLEASGVEITYHSRAAELATLAVADVLIIDGLALDAASARLAAAAATPVLLLHVAPDANALGPNGGVLLERLLRRARVVVTGEGTLESLRAQGRHIDAVKIEPGVPRHWRVKQRYAERAHALLGVANYLPGKGIDRMLEVLGGLRDLPWQLTVHGNTEFDPEYFRDLQDRVRALGLTSRVALLGAIPHDAINEAMIGADLLMQFSRHESYSMATAEAIACGLPVLSYRTGNAAVFGRSGLVRYMDDDAREGTVLASLLTSSRIYGSLRCTNDTAVRTWDDVGRDFVDFLEPYRWRRRLR